MNNKTFIIAAVLLVGVAIIANTPAKFSAGKEIQVSDFPKTIGNWQGTDIEIPERDYEILETRNLFIRDYKNAKTGEEVNLYIIYSQDNRRTLHPPEVCYSGGGSTILKKSVVQITDSLQANIFTIEEKNFKQLVAYWYKSKNLSTYNYMKQQIRVVLDRLLRKSTYGAMIRFAGLIKDNNEAAALEMLRGFIRECEPAINRLLP